jgi:hypothetical protein
VYVALANWRAILALAATCHPHKIDGFEASSNFLYGLVAGEYTQRRNMKAAHYISKYATKSNVCLIKMCKTAVSFD